MHIPRAFSPFPELCTTYMVKQSAKATGRTRVALSGSIQYAFLDLGGLPGTNEASHTFGYNSTEQYIFKQCLHM